MVDQVENATNTAEEVALKLLQLIRHLQAQQASKDKKAILDLYAECLLAVKEPRGRLSGDR